MAQVTGIDACCSSKEGGRTGERKNSTSHGEEIQMRHWKIVLLLVVSVEILGLNAWRRRDVLPLAVKCNTLLPRSWKLPAQMSRLHVL